MSMIGNFLQLTPAELGRLDANPSEVGDFISSDDVMDRTIDVDKAWQGIHFLLTGDDYGGAPPAANVVLGGIEIGEDVGYGPAIYLTPAEVQDVAKFVAAMTPELLGARYVAEELSEHEIYPNIWDDPEDDAVGYLMEYYATLREYYLDAAVKGNAMLKFVN
jgi:hypothetical protein